jgi:hypothetical protein
MRTRLSLLPLLAVLGLVTTGCITSDTLVKVKPNGSGTMEMTLLVNTEMFKNVGAMMGGGEVKTQGKSSLPDPADLAKRVSSMPGVKLVSSTPLKQGSSEGMKVVLAFDDVNKILVSENLPGKDITPKPGDEVRFALTKLPSGNSLLSIEFPDKPGEAAAAAAGTQNQARQNQPRQNQPKPSEKPDAAMLQMVAGFFKDMRVTIAVDVEGTLVRSSSPYVAGNRVTLLDLDFGQLMADPSALERMEALDFGPGTSITQARAAMERAGVKGVKVNDPKVTIEFK